MSATIKDVARATGLSIATISKYLNGGNVLPVNRERIEEAVRELGFRVNTIARGLKTSRTMTVGVLIPDLMNPFCTTLVSNVESILGRYGYSVMLCDYGRDPQREAEKVRFLLGKRVDGILAIPQRGWVLDGQQGEDRGVPVVFVDRAIEGIACDTVLVENRDASYRAVDSLLRRGHRRVGIIAGPLDIYTARERLAGYCAAHENLGLPVDETLVKRGDYEMESGYLLMNELLDMPDRPTAVHVTNYHMTLGAVMALNERNVRLPEDLSFIGFDNLNLARVVKPTLSIVVQPMEQLAQTAAAVLLKRMAGDRADFPEVYRLPTELVEGESVRSL